MGWTLSVIQVAGQNHCAKFPKQLCKGGFLESCTVLGSEKQGYVPTAVLELERIQPCLFSEPGPHQSWCPLYAGPPVRSQHVTVDVCRLVGRQK